MAMLLSVGRHTTMRKLMFTLLHDQIDLVIAVVSTLPHVVAGVVVIVLQFSGSACRIVEPDSLADEAP
ncbi:hypothetical protein ACWGTO_30600 [Mesorhizobium sp. PL10]